MARIDIRSNGGAALNDGVLQLENGVAMDTTLRNVADQNDTTSPLKISTTAVQIVSPLRITTDDPSDMYLDCEDGSANNRFNITRNTASQQVNLNFASNPAGSTTTVGAIRTFTDGVNLGEVVKFREDGQVTFTERVNVEADSLVTTESCSVIAASTTNANLVIAPNGTGALVASIPDGTATGGNARGDDAVDLQIIRSAATNVASGNYSVISGGQSNTVSSTYSTVSGGQSNTASTGSHATVVGGNSNTASGQYSVAGGTGNSASGNSAVAFGNSTIASGLYTTAIGNLNNATATASLVHGVRSLGYITAGKSIAAGRFSLTGDAQSQETILRNVNSQTFTTGATTVLGIDVTGTIEATPLIPSGNNRAWNVQVNWVAIVTAITGTATGISVGDVVTSIDLLAFKKIAGTSSASTHTSTATKLMVTTPAAYATCEIAYTAGASQEMALTFTGPTFVGGGSVTMRVVARIELTEVAF